MPGRRMLRDMMSVNDIYNYADPIMEMLREEYGSYDADTLDEVQVDERFAQRLRARGYEVRAGTEPAASVPTPAPTPAPIPTGISSETPVVPVTVVRTRRTTPGPTGGTASGTTRTRRTTTPSDGTRPATGRASAESTRPAPEAARPAAETGGDTASSAETPAPSSETGRPVRTRRTTRPRSTSGNNGEATS